jgi:plasmid stabilization system protein ParE
MVRINWTFQAKDDLKAIAEYISRDSKRYAKLQVIRIKNRTRILKTQVRSGKGNPSSYKL